MTIESIRALSKIFSLVLCKSLGLEEQVRIRTSPNPFPGGFTAVSINLLLKTCQQFVV